MAATKKNAQKKSTFRRINDWMHLWLGLSSGVIVFIVSITGCIYAFQQELSDMTQPYRHVKLEERPILPPSALRAHAAGITGNQPVIGVTYEKPGKAAILAYTDKKDGHTQLFMNPYSGEVIHRKVTERDFFRIILHGHFQLWLPRPIGQPIVAVAVLIFVVLLISGLIMWWPRKWSKAARKKSFSIKTDAGPKRVNYDLHNVLGFYALSIALILGLTGLVWGFKWYNKSYYWTVTGGKSFPTFAKGVSDSTALKLYDKPEDKVWEKMRPLGGNIQIQFANKPSDAVGVVYNPMTNGTYYKRQFLYFDQNTLERVKGGGIYTRSYEEATRGEKLYRMNYDIHVGAIGGLPGKMLAFFASLVCASLPVTGFLIWWNRKKKGKGKKAVSRSRQHHAKVRVVQGTPEPEKVTIP
ncbi:PepSY-associated TM helix domain-containing protein [Chitinophaga lutea]